MIRRQFLQTLGLPAMAAQAPASRQGQRSFDILIKNGEVRDPGRNFRQRADVAILDGKIAAIESNIPAERGLDVIDASGLYVTPGLVDLHTHPEAPGGLIQADPMAVRTGVTTWVSAGTYDSSQISTFRNSVVNPAQARIFGYVHLFNRRPGNAASLDAVKYVRDEMRQTGETVQKNRDILLGVKVYVGTNMNGGMGTGGWGRHGLDFLKIGREIGDQFKIPLMVHVSFAPPETPEVMELLRAGDVLTHCNNGHTLGIVDSGYEAKPGKLKPGVREARARGVFFDVGHGAGSFNFNATRVALDNGFPPDSISSDLNRGGIHTVIFDQPTTMSKYLYLGMSFDDVLLRSTYNPAKIVGRVPGLGTLTVGGPSDVALLAIEEGRFPLVDCQKNAVTARHRIVSRLTICRGKRMVFRGSQGADSIKSV
jgi:dihydroorotase